ncbi:MAG: FMN-binding protein, partial [Bacteroidales bacterium]|nr:FMN-binding protein [Bacteroidales bacterium]
VLPDGTVNSTRVLSHSETPGLGAKCQTDTKFIDQFKGLGPDKLVKLRADGGDVDAITASTITSRAYTLAVSNAVEVVKSLEKEN